MPFAVIGGDQALLAAGVSKCFFIRHQLIINRILHLITVPQGCPGAQILRHRRGHVGTEYVILAIHLVNRRIVNTNARINSCCFNPIIAYRKIKICRQFSHTALLLRDRCRFPALLCLSACTVVFHCLRARVL